MGRDGPRSIPINGACGGLWLSLGVRMAVLGSGAGAGSAGQHAGEDGALLLQAARVVPSSADRDKPALRRRGLAILIGTPADDGAIVPHAAGMTW